MTQPGQYTRNDLRNSIVGALRTRPNHSCKKEALPDEVCRHLKAAVRRRSRKRLKQVIQGIVNDLKQSGVLEEYKATNKRIRLTPDHELRLAKLCRLPNGLDVVFPVAGNPGLRPRLDECEDDDTLDLNPAHVQKMPDLSEPVTERPSAVSDDDDFDDLASDDSHMPDDGKSANPALLDVLTGNRRAPVEATPASVFDLSVLREQVEHYVRKHSGLSHQALLDRVSLTFRESGLVAKMTVRVNSTTKSVDFVTALGSLKVSADALLALSASDSFRSIPGVVPASSASAVQLRSHLPLGLTTVSTFEQALEQAVADVVSVLQLASESP